MTNIQKADFIRELFSAVQNLVLSKIDAMPTEWDDIELRQYAAEKFIAVSPFAHNPNLRLRAKHYKNEVLTNNL
jgi:hypothetical protein